MLVFVEWVYIELLYSFCSGRYIFVVFVVKSGP